MHVQKKISKTGARIIELGTLGVAHARVCVRVGARAYACVCVRVCVRARARVCVCARARA